MLGKFSVSGRPTNLDNSRTRAYCVCSTDADGVYLELFSLICRGVLLIWIIVGQGLTMFAVRMRMGLLGIVFSHLSFFFFFPLSLGDGPISTEILSERAVNPKQPTNQHSSVRF